MSSSRLFAGLICILLAQIASAGTLITFSDPGLVIFESEHGIQGYYVATEKGKTCDFFIFQAPGSAWKDIGGDGRSIEVNTFSLEIGQFQYEQRNSIYDTRGKINKNQDEWTMRTNVEPPGCGGGVGVFSRSGKIPDYRYFENKKIQATGIRVVRKKTILHNEIDGRYIKRSGYLTQDDIVALVETRDGFSYVRYFDPDYFSESVGKVTTGWVHTADLVDPFPPAAEH
ncbi:hypothetical protein WJ542_21405 [Paraburkholderia sp. B3]|uniref:hypothetical protein n=1 Tax=Paraburkholderia sp. B3 TaxID=3134791 RepID=UPI003982721C